MRRERLVAHLVDDGVPTAQQRVAVGPVQTLEALGHQAGAIDSTQALVWPAGMRHLAPQVDCHINAPTVAKRDRQVGAHLHDAEAGRLAQAGDDRLRAGVATAAFVVDRPVQLATQGHTRIS